MPQDTPLDPSANLLRSPAIRALSEERIAQLQQFLTPFVAGVRIEAAKLPRLSLPASSPLTIREKAVDSKNPESHRAWTSGAFALVTKERTATELVEHLLLQITETNPRWNAFSRVHREETLAEAARTDVSRGVGIPRGPLHGVPIAVKDNIGVTGWPQTASSLVLSDAVASGDATAVARLRYAGAVILGQTVMHELAFGMTSINPHLGSVRNPWDPRRICGGSSGGSAAAVAAGLAPAALGTDTGGSIRCPAALCGIVGFKPSYGAVSRHGVTPLGYSLDTVGPLARTAAQCLAIHEAIAGADPMDDATLIFEPHPRTEPNLNGLRIGLPATFFADPMEDGIRRAISRAIEVLRKAGAVVREVKFPELTALNQASTLVLLTEAAAAFEWALEQGDKLGVDVRTRFEHGLLIQASDYHHAQRLRAHWMRQVEDLFKECDVLLTAASPVVAPLIDDPFVEFGGERVDARTAISRYLRSINFLGLPAVTLPCGIAEEGMPAALQLIGAFGEDEFLLRASILSEEVLEFESLQTPQL